MYRRIIYEAVRRVLREAQGYAESISPLVDEVIGKLNACRHKRTGKITATKTKKFTIDVAEYLPKRIQKNIRGSRFAALSTNVDFFVQQLTDDNTLAYFTVKKAFFEDVPQIYMKQEVAVMLDDPDSVADFKSTLHHELVHMLEQFSKAYTDNPKKTRFSTDRMVRYKGENKSISLVKYFFGRTEQNAYLNTLCRYIEETFDGQRFGSVRDAVSFYSAKREELTNTAVMRQILGQLEDCNNTRLFAELAYNLNTSNVHRNDSAAEKAYRAIRNGKGAERYGDFDSGYGTQGDRVWIHTKNGREVAVNASDKRYDADRMKEKVLSRLWNILRDYEKRLDKAEYSLLQRLFDAQR